MKKFLTFLLLFMCVVPTTAFGAGMDSFAITKTYTQGTFQDISQDEWFYSDIAGAYEYGLTEGTSDDKYSPYGLVSVAEVITFAARLNAIYYKNEIPAAGEKEQWYTPSVKYATDNKIIKENEFSARLEKPAERGEVAYILGNALPFSVYDNINTGISAITDMSNKEDYYNEAIMLFRAGVITGRDDEGTFAPTENITRAEIATVMYRIVNKNARLKLNFNAASPETKNDTKTENYNAEQISDMSSASVFLIAVHNKSGEITATGSGFFIDKSGIAVTNYHVIKDASSAQIMTIDGKTYDVDYVRGYDQNRDIAVLQIKGSDFPSVKIGNSDNIKNGQKIYCIGSPIGLDNTITEGLISNVSRTIENKEYIQISAPISPGSSGGAVFNDSGEVVGITSASAEEGQNINLAIPINSIYDISWVLKKSLAELATGNVKKSEVITYYKENSKIPDYTSVVGVEKEDTYDDDNYYYYQYALDEDQFNAYVTYLSENGFSLTSKQIDAGAGKYIYYMSDGVNSVAIAADTTENKAIVAIQKKSSAPNKSSSSDNSTAYYEGTSAPTYTYLIGRECKKVEKGDGFKTYTYDYEENELSEYITYMSLYGWYMSNIKKDNGTLYIYLTSGIEDMVISYGSSSNEVKINI
ncbi:MAG: trypsin-like peptidase domain-containing protein [Bacillota bacterium]|nr:trypsin-like peptidase domain-containing protein [Bacillota bacterium]